MPEDGKRMTFAFSFNGDKLGFRASKAAEGFLDDYQGLAGGKMMS